MEVVSDPNQKIDQVFCAAMNVGQGHSGMVNARCVDAENKVKNKKENK